MYNRSSRTASSTPTSSPTTFAYGFGSSLGWSGTCREDSSSSSSWIHISCEIFMPLRQHLLSSPTLVFNTVDQFGSRSSLQHDLVSSVAFASADIGEAHADISSGASEVFAAANATFDIMNLGYIAEEMGLDFPKPRQRYLSPSTRGHRTESR